MNLGHGMAKTCIICGGAAGSGEHVFPAAFGGRRTNRGIYCDTHNNALGPHVAVLLESFDVMNAMAGVRPDRHDAVRPAKVDGTDGEAYLVGKNSVGLAPPPPLGKAAVETIEKTLKFESDQQIDEWMAQQRANGFEFKYATRGIPQTKFFTEPILTQKVFGGEPFFIAVAYIALTFLAHHFPSAARSASVQSIKDVVTGKAAFNEEVWWLRPEDLEALPKTPFTTGHTAAVAIDSASSRATALVSFFGAVSFGVDLGTVDLQETRRITTHIDPLAEKAPEDLVVLNNIGERLNLSSRDQSSEYFKAVATGKAPNPFEKLMIHSSDAQLDETAQRLLPLLLSTAKLTGFAREAEVARVMNGERQRVFNLLHGSISEFTGSESGLPPQLLKLTAPLIAADKDSPTGLSKTAEATLTLACSLINRDIQELMEKGALDGDTVKELISGHKGVVLIFKNIVEPLLLGALQNRR